jgi:hypothetical protein
MKVGYQFNLSKIKPIKSYSFVFVCQKGELEIESLLLAASLKRFVKTDYELIAAIPGPEDFFGKPSDLTLDLLKEIGVKFFHFQNEFVKKGKTELHYLIANKIHALKAPINSEKLIFLDSDNLCCENFYGDPCFLIPVNISLAGHFSSKFSESFLKKSFEVCLLDIPNIRFRIEGSEDLYLPPYFSSGFVAVDSKFVNTFSDIWIEAFKKIDKNNILKNPYFCDEVSLSIIINQINVPFSILGKEYRENKFFHYVEPFKIKMEIDKLRLVKSLLVDYPKIRKLMNQSPRWKVLFDKT